MLCLLKEEAPWKEGDTLSVKGKGALNEYRHFFSHKEAHCPDSALKNSALQEKQKSLS